MPVGVNYPEFSNFFFDADKLLALAAAGHGNAGSWSTS